jgi:beta-1,4-N-acetylglucosaminyltransferase
MILVTVGTHPQGFDRLVKAADELAAEFNEPVMIQYGSSTYQPRNAQGFSFETSQRMAELTREARVVVTHAAAGAIILGLQSAKPLVVVPRLKQFNEHIDDHQKQLAKALSTQRKVIAVEQPDAQSLRGAIEQAGQLGGSMTGSQQLIQALRLKLIAWENADGG